MSHTCHAMPCHAMHPTDAIKQRKLAQAQPQQPAASSWSSNKRPAQAYAQYPQPHATAPAYNAYNAYNAHGRGRGRGQGRGIGRDMAASHVSHAGQGHAHQSKHRKLVNVHQPQPQPSQPATTATATTAAVDAPVAATAPVAPVASVSYIRKGNSLVRADLKAQPAHQPVHQPAAPSQPSTGSLPVIPAIHAQEQQQRQIRQQPMRQSVNKKLVIKDGIAYRTDGRSLVAAGQPSSLSSLPSRSSHKSLQPGRTHKTHKAPKAPMLITINGVQFATNASRRTLVRVNGQGPVSADSPTDGKAAAVPKKVMVNGVKYVRSKRGNMILASRQTGASSVAASHGRGARSGGPTAGARPGASMTWRPTGWNTLKPKRKVMYCQFYRYGKRLHLVCCLPCDSCDSPDGAAGRCTKGDACRYAHDPRHIALCPSFLKSSGTCSDPGTCVLSHVPLDETTPFCIHFERGWCSKETCLYLHVKLSPGAPVCADFVKEGYCERGKSCLKRHVFLCPEFEAGSCPRGDACRFPHYVPKARRAAGATSVSASTVAGSAPASGSGGGSGGSSGLTADAGDPCEEDEDDEMQLPPIPDFSRLLEQLAREAEVELQTAGDQAEEEQEDEAADEQMQSDGEDIGDANEDEVDEEDGEEDEEDDEEDDEEEAADDLQASGASDDDMLAIDVPDDISEPEIAGTETHGEA
ncbi:hypothetical protein BC831DRAFT_472468 [Entophlyctis helioformis]|nr:hypothetical protein BC831DRAFT_472468 [Entophlyctis helioformis]